MNTNETKVGLNQFNTDFRLPSVMTVMHQHDEVEINFLLSGSFTYLMAGRLTTVPAGRLAIFWAGIPHQLVGIKECGRCFWFSIPLSWILQKNFPKWYMEALFTGRSWVDASPDQGDPDLCRRMHEDLKSGNTERRLIFQLELEARWRRFILNQSPQKKRSFKTKNNEQNSSNSGMGEMLHIQKMIAHIVSHYTEPLQVEDIVEKSHLSPNYAMNLFRKVCGMSLMQYVIHHRISHAKQLLATTDAKVVDIAYESGFRTLSHFYETFKRTCGYNPQFYRKHHCGKGR